MKSAIAIVSVLIIAAVAYFGAYKFAAKEVAFAASRPSSPSVTLTRPAKDEQGVPPNAFISCDLNLPNQGHGVEAKTMTGESVQLRRADNDAIVAAQLNTSGAGDAIVLTPMDLLEPNTRYTFTVTPKVTDTSGAYFEPFEMTFTTAAGSLAQNYPVAFEKLSLEGTKIESAYTGMAIGPDGKLYAGTFDGRILRFVINADGTLGAAETIPTLIMANHGPRTITGLAFDPTSTAANIKVWVSHSQMAIHEGKIEGASDWTGKITVMSGANLSEVKDAIVNLPRAWKDHMNFQPAFGPDGCLYFSQGSHTSNGAPDKKWNFGKEHRLTAAMLRFDPKLAGSLPLNVKTEDGGTYDPSAAGAALTLYATGIRSGFDLLFHTNGHIYIGLNGAAAGGATPGIDKDRQGQRVPAINNLNETTEDLLLDIKKGGYYGHPNPSRGEYVLMGGNPTAGEDEQEIRSYPVGLKPEPNFVKPAFDFGKSVSPNGLCEYTSPAFGGAFNGKILVTRYSGGKDVIVLTPGPDGSITEAVTGIDGLKQFSDPLDIVEDAKTGNLYIAEYGGRQITLVKPKAGATSAKVFRQAVSF